jgi:hypothetical protein
MTQFLHGVEVIEVASGARPVRTVSSAVIGIVGSAPKGPINAPTVVTSATEAAQIFGTPTLAGWASGFTLPDALTLLFAQARPVVVVINVLDPAVDKTTVAAADLAINATTKTITLNKKWVREVVVKVAGGGGSALVAGTDYSLDAEAGVITILPGGALAAAAQANVAFAWIDPSKVDAAQIIGSTLGDGSRTGTLALKDAQSVTGISPRIILAPGWTHQRTGGNANTVVASLLGVANTLRAVVIADGPNTTDADAITYSNDWGSARIFIVDPWVKANDSQTGEVVAQPASSAVAGLIAKVDTESGFWHSPSNHDIAGIVGTGRGVEFTLGDAASRANLLNAENVATIIRQEGYRLWGNRTVSLDPQFAFLAVRRTADIIQDSVMRAHLWAVDRPITRNYVESLVESVNAYLRTLQSLGAILGGKCWADPDLNTAATLSQGVIYLNFDFTPVYPAEHIVFRSKITNDYLTELFADAA